MRFDEKQKSWLIASIVILVICTIVYIPYALTAPHGPEGGSTLGLAFGIVGFGMMIFAGLLSARKQVPIWRVGSAQTWLRGHLWLGLISLPIILFHAGFHFGGSLTTVLMTLFLVVVASGVLGAVLQNYLPRTMTLRVPMETVYEEITHVRAQLTAEAEQLVSSVCGTVGGGPAPAANPGTRLLSPGTPQVSAAVVAAADVDERTSARLHDFYAHQLRPFLEAPKTREHPLFDSKRAEGIFEQLRTLLPPAVHPALDDLEDICEEERQLTRQERLHLWLHTWLLVHVPLSFALLVLGAVHAVMALRY